MLRYATEIGAKQQQITFRIKYKYTFLKPHNSKLQQI